MFQGTKGTKKETKTGINMKTQNMKFGSPSQDIDRSHYFA